jgi:uncharacterized Zn-binding protein involved in type VI secretion
VLIEKRPAWRALSDTATCSVSNPINGAPHGAGIAQPGSQTVFINKLPAARMGDTITEANSPAPNSIVMGAPTVLIR